MAKWRLAHIGGGGGVRRLSMWRWLNRHQRKPVAHLLSLSRKYRYQLNEENNG